MFHLQYTPNTAGTNQHSTRVEGHMHIANGQLDERSRSIDNKHAFMNKNML